MHSRSQEFCKIQDMLTSNENSGFMGALNVVINSMDSLHDIQDLVESCIIKCMGTHFIMQL